MEPKINCTSLDFIISLLQVMMFFFNRTGLERMGVIGPKPGLLWTGLKALDRRAGDRIAAGLVCRLWMYHSSAKTRKKKGLAGASPVVAPMPKSVSF